MALSFKAEKTSVVKIFKIEEQYVIPAYQRPYSWEHEQCSQLYNDLIHAYKENNVDEYFIGNLIVAKSAENKDVLEVIDGQQRLTTLLLLIKTLYILEPEVVELKDLLEKKNRKGKDPVPRIKSNIFEIEEASGLLAVLKYTKADLDERLMKCKDKSNNIDEKKGKNRFDLNILYFYHWLTVADKSIDLGDFIDFLLDKVYLLPIQLEGDKANDKALTIFETINNRGMNLEDADIFKAKLYQRAQNAGEGDTFLSLWKDFKSSCQELKLTIDDIFRYYAHIVRGNQGITTSETKLRDFFQKETFSPLELNKYKETLDHLSKILGILKDIEDLKRKEQEVAKWLQLIDKYTNHYPKYALVVYLFKNENYKNEMEQFIEMLQSLVRYVYYKGSTTTVKFEIYNMIQKISSGHKLDNYYQDLEPDFFDPEKLGQLKFGFALLAFYLKPKQKALSSHEIGRLVGHSDKKHLTDDWADIIHEAETFNTLIDSLGNFIIADKAKKYVAFAKKIEHYKKSDLYNKESFLIPSFTYENFKERDNELKQYIIKFFKSPK